ncbi:hypothetical protein Pfo_026677 [Paulownia fortunei]|nr:hypothetical protein Pfo_026677 [Paulownia fortunei]
MEEKVKKEFDPITAQEIAAILDSQLTSEEKSILLVSYWTEDDIIIPPQEVDTCSTSSGVELEEKVQHTEAKVNDDHLPGDVISELNDESPSLLSSQQEAKANGALDPLTDEEASSILDSDLTSEEKSSLLASNLMDEYISPSKVNTGSTSTRVELEGKIEHIEEKAKGDHDNLLNDGTSERIDESLSFHSPQKEAKANVALQPKVTLEEKSTYNQTEEDITPSEVDKSSTSSGIELDEKNEHAEMKTKGDHESSSFRAQVTPVEGCLILQEMKELFTVRVKGCESNADGTEEEMIHKQEAVCKYCYQYVFKEKYVLKAKCRCKLTLIHEECEKKLSSEKGNKCRACEQEIENICVALSSPPQISGEKLEKPSSVSRRFWSCLGNF